MSHVRAAYSRLGRTGCSFATLWLRFAVAELAGSRYLDKNKGVMNCVRVKLQNNGGDVLRLMRLLMNNSLIFNDRFLTRVHLVYEDTRLALGLSAEVVVLSRRILNL